MIILKAISIVLYEYTILLKTYIGASSEPCCINAPKMNQKLFLNENWLIRYWGSSTHGYGFCHSLGDNLPIINMAIDTIRYDTPNSNHTVKENGETNINKLGGTGSGFL